MQVYRDFDEISRDVNSIITVGTFDGVHKGHQLVIDRLLELSKDGSRHVIMTIDPHPQIVLQRQDRHRIHLLTTIKERIELFKKFGIQNVLVIPFSYEFSQTAPEVFIKEFLYEKVGFKKILIGHDHMFGKNREGNSELLNSLSIQLGFEVEQVDAHSESGIIISSTKIRKMLEESKIEEANEMLGHKFGIRGKVTHGNGRGAGLGYPTANIRPPDIYKILPGNGVYLVSSELDGNLVYGMANIGLRPTVTSDTKPTLEVHFFDFDSDLYGMELTVSFHKFIRKEEKFKNIDALLHQIEKDERKCRDLVENL